MGLEIIFFFNFENINIRVEKTFMFRTNKSQNEQADQYYEL